MMKLGLLQFRLFTLWEKIDSKIKCKNIGGADITGKEIKQICSVQSAKKYKAGWSSWLAHWAHNPKVGGSSPPPATKKLVTDLLLLWVLPVVNLKYLNN